MSWFKQSPAQEEQSRLLRVEYGVEDMSPAERRQAEAEEDANYAEHIAGQGTHRETWFSEDGLTLYWREYVIDQHGHQHTRSEGHHYCGRSGGIAAVGGMIEVEVVCGELVEDVSIRPRRKKQLSRWERFLKVWNG